MKAAVRKAELEAGVAALEVLVAHRDEFLGFLDKRLRDRAVAEDVLQDAFLKAVGKLHTVEKPESLVPWFYSLLRTTLVDATRRKAARSRALDALSAEPAPEASELASAAACACVHDVLRSMKHEHAEVLTRIAVEEVAVKDYAREAGISSGNAAVRSFRAREALRRGITRSCGSCAQQGCGDCTCRRPAAEARVA